MFYFIVIINFCIYLYLKRVDSHSSAEGGGNRPKAVRQQPMNTRRRIMKTRRRRSGVFCSITMALKETAGLYETLKVEWNKKNPNLSKCGEILSKLKVMLPFTFYV